MSRAPRRTHSQQALRHPIDLRAVDLGELHRDLPGGQPSGGQRQHDLVNTVQATLAFAHNARLETVLPVPRHLDLHRAHLGEHRLSPSPVAGVPAVTPGRIVLVITQMLTELRRHGGLEHRLVSPVSRPPGPMSSIPSARAVSTRSLASW